MIKNISPIARKITLVYGITSVLWILLSDHLLNYFITDPMLAKSIAILKGWFFVGITAALLYKMIDKNTKLLVASEQQLRKQNEEIMVTYEELLANEEELKQQFDELLHREEQISQRNESLHALHEALQTSQNRNQALIAALPDAIFQLDQEGTLLDYKKGKDVEWLLDMEGKIGQRVETFFSPPQSQQLMENVGNALTTGVTQLFTYEYIYQDKAKYREVRINASSPTEVIAIVRDITTRKAMEDKLHYLALHDKVTGLYNRVYFEEKLQKLTENGQMSVGIIMCDIDGLKLVNDTFGHQAGDQLLVSAARIIADCVGENGDVARVGGDEFAIIIEKRDLLQIEEICRCINEGVQEFCHDNTEIPMSISTGLSVKKYPEQSMIEVFKAADDNMYRQKLYSSQSVRSSIVQTLGKALEARDFVTGGHAERLQHLIVELAIATGLRDNRLSDLRLFGHFHDIGKVGIPDEILFKPGRLTTDEFEVMKRHCEIGYRIAQASGDLAPIADWILKHQEWWNGQGYPLGIKGAEIPLPCRILSIVDAYDAMTNDRPYRPAMFHDAAIAELERCAGTQFDPTLVGLFKYLVVRM